MNIILSFTLTSTDELFCLCPLAPPTNAFDAQDGGYYAPPSYAHVMISAIRNPPPPIVFSPTFIYI